ncbi:hypothetical protein [Actinokineospora pegani]|uniref:hypothetical protein n=1 Tax=Actinokineospora pegani TaxID=2654637 RepID=UPI0012E9C2BC|nr:hypothetical protein [Actinokineospora pegani]
MTMRSALGLAALGLALVPVPAGAAVPPPCDASQLEITTGARPDPVFSQRMHYVRFVAQPGVTCVLKGPLRDLSFFAGDGAAIDVPQEPPAAPGSHAVVTDSSPKQAYILLPDTVFGPTAARITFTLPSDGSDQAVDVPFAGVVTGTARLGNVTDPAA